MASRSDIKAGSAYIELLLNDSKFIKGLRSASTKLKDFGGGIAKIGAGVTAAGAAITGAMAAAVNKFVSFGSTIDDIAQRTGIGAKAISEFAHAAEMGGTDLATFEGGVQKMQKVLAAAADGNRAAQDTFRDLGLSVSALMAMSPEEQFEAIGKKIAGIEDPAKRTAAAMEVFGKSGVQLIPMLGELEALREEARRMGFTMSDEAAASAASLGDVFENLAKTAKFVAINIGAVLEPYVSKAAKTIQRIATRSMEWIKLNGQLVATVAAVGAGLMIAGTAITGLGLSIAAAGMALGGIVSALGVVGSILGAVLSPLGLITAALVGGVAVWAMYTESGQAAVAGITEFLGELLKTATDTFGGIADAIMAGDLALAGQIAMAGLKLAFLQGFAALSGAVGGALGDLIGTIGTQIAGGDFAGVWSTVVLQMADVWAGFCEGMIAVFTTAIRGVADMWQKTTSQISDWILKNASEGGILGELLVNGTGVDVKHDIEKGKRLDAALRARGTDPGGAGGLEDMQASARADLAGQTAALRAKLDGMDRGAQERTRQAAIPAARAVAGGADAADAAAAAAQAELDALRAKAGEAAAEVRKQEEERKKKGDGIVTDTGGIKRDVMGSFSAAALSAQGVGGDEVAENTSRIAKLAEKQLNVAEKQLEKAGLGWILG